MELYDPTTPQAKLVAVIGWDILGMPTRVHLRAAARVGLRSSAWGPSPDTTSTAGPSTKLPNRCQRMAIDFTNIDHSARPAAWTVRPATACRPRSRPGSTGTTAHPHRLPK